MAARTSPRRMRRRPPRPPPNGPPGPPGPPKGGPPWRWWRPGPRPVMARNPNGWRGSSKRWWPRRPPNGSACALVMLTSIDWLRAVTIYQDRLVVKRTTGIASDRLPCEHAFDQMIVCLQIPRFALTVAAGRDGQLAAPLALAPEAGREPVVGEPSAVAETYGVRA